ncbi:MAG: hypothetical protein IKL94_02960, partial [Clostridia bacterium]|nr:hypothetical protein [Clostridia bacterium]
KKVPWKLICTPKERHFWRCIFFMGKIGRKNKVYTQFNVCDKKVYLSPVLDLFNYEVVSYSITTTTKEVP